MKWRFIARLSTTVSALRLNPLVSSKTAYSLAAPNLALEPLVTMYQKTLLWTLRHALSLKNCVIRNENTHGHYSRQLSIASNKGQVARLLHAQTNDALFEFYQP